jgi:hypothetical protein
MAFHDIERKKIENALADLLTKIRPPEHIRSELDYGYKLSGQSVEIFEIRPQWNDKRKIHEHPFAKATFVKTQNLWKVYWQRADLKWHGYQPELTVSSIEKFVAVVLADEYACFFG